MLRIFPTAKQGLKIFSLICECWWRVKRMAHMCKCRQSRPSVKIKAGIVWLRYSIGQADWAGWLEEEHFRIDWGLLRGSSSPLRRFEFFGTRVSKPWNLLILQTPTQQTFQPMANVHRVQNNSNRATTGLGDAACAWRNGKKAIPKVLLGCNPKIRPRDPA